MAAASIKSRSPDGGDPPGFSDQENGIWRRDFRLLLGGSALSQLGTLGAAAANPLLALALTHSPIVTGWVAAAGTLPGLFLHVPVGLLVDRYDRRRIMLISQVIRVLNSMVLVVGLFSFANPWPFLVVAAMIDGTCAVFFRIAELAAVRYVVPDAKAESAMGKNEARHHVALVLGRPVGGALFAAGRVYPYILDAATSLLSVFSLLFLRTKFLQSSRAPRGMAFGMSKRRMLVLTRLGFRRIYHDRFLFVSLLVCAIANVGFQIIILLLVVEAERRQLSGSVIGAMLATSGVAGFAGAITAAPVVRRLCPVRTVKYSVLLWLPLLLIVAWMKNPLIGMVAWGACSFMGAYINVALAVHQTRVVPSRVLGRVEGVSQFLTTGAVTLGAFAGGYVITAFGPRLTAALVTAAFGVIAIVVFSLIRDPDRRRAAEPVEEGAPEAAESVPITGTAIPVGEPVGAKA
ncbi:MFS transporter [Actinomadura darangshiensis]|uniref:MFS transporter n=1 Tax=Actinomadura darangshiensis TaxID=705336 RepID=UPI00140C7740|nr:MFS transporter [Actinomadura darangshiensis]